MLGVIYSPYTGELFSAEKGKGAYLNGHSIRVSDHERLSDCVGLLEFNAYYKNEVEQALDHARRIYLACQDIRTFGSAALEFAYVACGRADVYLGRYLKPWDFAAGMGTCGLVGPIGVINSTENTPFMWIGLALVCIVLPAILALVFNEIMRKLGWIKTGDMTLDV